MKKLLYTVSLLALPLVVMGASSTQTDIATQAPESGARVYDPSKVYLQGDTTIYNKTESSTGDDTGGTASERLLPTVNKATEDASTERVLPTVNKATDDTSSQRLLPTVNKRTESASSGDEEGGSNERVLPTVNKRTTEAKIEVRGWDPEKKESIVGKVRAETDKNLELNSVEIAEDAVSVDYAAPAKLFGFIPMTARLHISTDANYRVKVKFPWYRFLIRTDYADIAAETESVFQHNQTDLEFLKKQGTDGSQFRIFELLSNVLKTKHDTVKNSISNVR
jgi:hypothetical protein